MFVAGYLATNVLGFLLMHKGVGMWRNKENRPVLFKEIKKDLLISLVYVIIIVILFYAGFIKVPVDLIK